MRGIPEAVSEACRAELIVYGDASGYQQQTTGRSDYDMIRTHFAAHSSIEGGLPGPKSNPSVRERINLMNRQLRRRRGWWRLLWTRSARN